MTQMHIKNHYVPELYLKRWGDTQNKIWVYDLLVEHQKVPEWKRLPISGVGYQRYLYTQLISDAESDYIENWFSQEFESPANKVIEKVTSESRLSKNDWEILIRFLAAQDVRTPAEFYHHVEWAQKEYPKIFQEALEHLKEKLEDGAINDIEPKNKLDKFPFKFIKQINQEEQTASLKIESFIGRETWIRAIKHKLEHTQNILHTHKWSIVRPAKGFQWFTSDNPVVKLNFFSEGEYDLKGGWGNKNGNIILPLGPEHAMFVEIGQRPFLKGTRLNIETTKLFRKIIAENAHRKIFNSRDDMGILELRNRIVDKEQLKFEKNRLEQWHDDNSKLEREYASKN